MFASVFRRVWHLVITPYLPDPAEAGFMSRAQTREDQRAVVTAAVLGGTESRRLFGVDLARRGIQPVFLRIANRSDESLRLQMVGIDPRYFTPLEAAAAAHFSIVRRLSGFGLLGWLFLPLLLLVPFKLVTAHRANRRMDDLFRQRGFRLAPIPAGATAEGFVFTTLDLGTKAVRVRLVPAGDIREAIARLGGRDDAEISSQAAAPEPRVDFVFMIPVPGIAADYMQHDFESLVPPGTVEPVALAALDGRLEAMPPATTNRSGSRLGDPINLVVIGDFEMLLAAFVARWDESETITLATCWKTVRAFLLGSDYRYSPVSALHLFGRPQDIALQRTRGSVNDRIHLRLWLTRLAFRDQPVWVGQVSRDIGVRFTTKAWNLTTHRIDPDVDESRDYVIEDLVLAGRATAAGYVGGVGAAARTAPRRNLTGDSYVTDGRRAVIVLAPARTG
ncbi:MAG: hypothetical protein FJ284_07800 [Planctomycetes bacterium]|nr:hypothetical protein [Planctomycetota bacterium]